MPKEQVHFAERVGWTTSKNAKDRSNSATARASQGDQGHLGQAFPGTLGGVGERLSRFGSGKDSEKDSGYSEASSDSVQNDLDDQHSSTGQPHRKNSRSAVAVDVSSGVGVANCNVGHYEKLSPVYVIKNLVVKPSRPEQLLHPPLTWAGGWHSLSGPKGSTQLLLIQQPAITGLSSSSSALTTVSAPADTQNQANIKSCGSRTGSSSNNHHHHGATKNSYLPILNSYPRIAPHPRKEGQSQGKSSGTLGVVEESRGGSGEGQSQSKRVCTEEEMKRESVSTTNRNPSSHHYPHHHHYHGCHRDLHKVQHGSETPAHPPSTGHTKSYRHSHHDSRCDAVGSPSVSSSQMASLPSHNSSSHSPSSSSSSSCPTSYSSQSSSAAHSPYRPRQGRAISVVAAASGHLSDSPSECSSVRQRRFLNTAEILSQSGLLAITLRTKELLKQSDATEQEIAQLRQHTQLLCQAALAGQQVPKDGSNGLQRLLQAMAHSGSYPGLDSSSHVKVISNNQKQSERRGEGREADGQGRAKNVEQQLVSLQGVDEGVAPPSPLFAPSPEAENMDQVNSLAGSLSMDKDLTNLAMSPESATFDNYLF